MARKANQKFNFPIKDSVIKTRKSAMSKECGKRGQVGPSRFAGRETSMTGQDRAERRSADRIKDSSNIRVSGVSKSGQSFQEMTNVIDVSAGGISFVLKTSIEPGVLVELMICSEPGGELLPKYQTGARVLRVCRQAKSDLFLVAARFEGDVVDLAGDGSLEALVQELQLAVQYDESHRSQFE
jgi:hypothetical protein